MERKKSGKGFKLKGHTLPGINQKIEGKNLADGRHPSSAFQQNESPMARLGVYKTVDGELVQTTSSDPEADTFTGEDANRLRIEEGGEVSPEMRKRRKEYLKDIYQTKKQAHSNELDRSIQSKIDKGQPLTEREKKAQANAIKNMMRERRGEADFR
mgnify:CR=1 FL=1|tara:strand:+ start:71 stop:538 length:468 start_codon:yes stop_codon:yes gene_type:complete